MKPPAFLINQVRKKRFNLSSLPRPVHTVCESAKCPNRGECFENKTVTFLLLGDICTRNCRFCGVPSGKPVQEHEDIEPILEAIRHFNLEYVVLTSVTRDDLSDGGASEFVRVMQAIKTEFPTVKLEILTPDFGGDRHSLDFVLREEPLVFNHNIEMAPRFFPDLRSGGDYEQSLKVLEYASLNYPNIHIKSGFMLGLGEEYGEIMAVLADLAKVGVQIVTIGQYLAPNKHSVPVSRYVEPEEYATFVEWGKTLGLTVIAGPLIRSSYRADRILQTAF